MSDYKITSDEAEAILNELKKFSFKQQRLENKAILDLVDLEELTLLQVAQMSETAAAIFTSDQSLMQYFSIEDILTMDSNAYLFLTDDRSKMLYLSDKQTLSKEKVLRIDSYDLYLVLCDENVQRALKHNLIDFDKLEEVLCDVEDVEGLLDGNFVDYILHKQIKDKENTQTISIEQSALDSAKRLKGLYWADLDDSLIQNMIDGLANLSKDTDNKDIAIVFLKLLLENQIYPNMSAPNLDISIKQLVMLCYLAICDDHRSMTSQSKGLRALATACYEILRGDNINNEQFIDDGEEDSPICFGGAFNKLIEQFVGYHPAFEQVYITKASASLYLPCVVKQQLLDYLSAYYNQDPNDGFMQSIFKQLSNTGEIPELVWIEIKEAVSKEVFEHYKSVFDNEMNDEFFTFIEYGRNINFDIKNYKKSKDSVFIFNKEINGKAKIEELTP
ncbi:MAG: hypothetical protein EP298_11220 [Gammaproteobacteria bacterium]|nr:MAG: hypothetical protein EP298_11220 [Gammaproteobacteria bacterium]UTW43189.1 hypothetical protein KFE69_03325 [bacterium SCSIO 12844]